MSEDDPNIGLTVSASDDSASLRSGHSSGKCRDEAKVRLSVDLVAAARWHLAFLASLSDSIFLHHTAAIRESIRRSVIDSFLLPPPFPPNLPPVIGMFDSEQPRDRWLSRPSPLAGTQSYGCL